MATTNSSVNNKIRSRTLNVSGPLDVYEVVTGINLTSGREAEKSSSSPIKTEDTVLTPAGRARGKFFKKVKIEAESNKNDHLTGQEEVSTAKSGAVFSANLTQTIITKDQVQCLLLFLACLGVGSDSVYFRAKSKCDQRLALS
ncbi:hypothetical protein DFH28DRAFT_934612 [Melampsora americana]|nr:hypothetical protein DFH28DRAFT_934612 [Melampsora americana]